MAEGSSPLDSPRPQSVERSERSHSLAWMHQSSCVLELRSADPMLLLGQRRRTLPPQFPLRRRLQQSSVTALHRQDPVMEVSPKREHWTEADMAALPAGEHDYFDRKSGRLFDGDRG